MKREGKSAAIAALKGDPIGQADGVFALMSQAAIATHRAVQGIFFNCPKRRIYLQVTKWLNLVSVLHVELTPAVSLS